MNVGLEVTAGSSFCQIDANGCATDGAGAHGNYEACTIRVGAAGTLTATQFDTETGYDYITIGGIRYEGSTGPTGVAVAAGSTFTWLSDGSVTRAGWTICPGIRCGLMPSNFLQPTATLGYAALLPCLCLLVGAAGTMGSSVAMPLSRR